MRDDDRLRDSLRSLSDSVQLDASPSGARRRGATIRRRRRFGIAGVALAAVIIAVPILARSNDPKAPTRVQTVDRTIAPTGSLRDLTPFGSATVSQAALAWDGHAVLLAGGNVGEDVAMVRRIVAYDPGSDRATDLAPLPFNANLKAAGVWTGSEFIVLGGDMAPTSGPMRAAAYSPSTGRWTQLPDSGLRARSDASITWTGHEILVWGGYVVDQLGQDAGPVNDGAAFDPATGLWRPITASPETKAGSKGTAWTGTEWLLVGGIPWTDRGDASCTAYNPTTDTWRTIMERRCTSIQDIWTHGDREVVEMKGSGCRAQLSYYDPRSGSLQDVAPYTEVNPLLPCLTRFFADATYLYAIDSTEYGTTRVSVLVGEGWVEVANGPVLDTSQPITLVSAGTGRILAFNRNPKMGLERVVEITVDSQLSASRPSLSIASTSIASTTSIISTTSTIAAGAFVPPHPSIASRDPQPEGTLLDGVHLAVLSGVDPATRRLTFTLVYWLQPSEYAAAVTTGIVRPEDDCLSLDYCQVVQDTRPRTMVVAPAARLSLVNWARCCESRLTGDMQELVASVSEGRALFLLTARGGTIIAVDEQYRP
jgi:hypothetical protein